MNTLNTHTYDGQIPHFLTFENIGNLKVIDDSIKISAFNILRSYIISNIPNLDPLVLFYFDQIVNDKYSPSNFDTTNNMSAYDILYLICIHMEDMNMIALSDQLLDMRTGNCPQGRVIRLYQILMCSS